MKYFCFSRALVATRLHPSRPLHDGAPGQLHHQPEHPATGRQRDVLPLHQCVTRIAPQRDHRGERPDVGASSRRGRHWLEHSPVAGLWLSRCWNTTCGGPASTNDQHGPSSDTDQWWEYQYGSKRVRHHTKTSIKSSRDVLYKSVTALLSF